MDLERIGITLGEHFDGTEGFTVTLIAILGAILAGLLISATIVFVMRRIDARVDPEKVNIPIDAKRWRGPLNLLLPALCVTVVTPVLRLPEGTAGVFSHLLGIWTISAVAFLSVRLIQIGRDTVLERYDVGVKDNLKARAAHTQIRVIVRILMAAVLLIAASSILITFERVRQIGVSLLASAGIAGVVIGFAAQRSIATVLAGIQIALTQPIRVEDVVIVEGEWGWIEEITLTYVVVRIWDLRRLIVPITYFIEKPFQNWTRTSADLLGTVFLYVDYSMPMEPLRKEFRRILEENPLWDRKVCVLQVTDAKERTVEVRALLSTEDSPKGWDLRVHVREKLIEFMQKNYPENLSRTRVLLDRAESS